MVLDHQHPPAQVLAAATEARHRRRFTGLLAPLGAGGLNPEPEARANAGFALHAGAAAHQLGQTPHDGQAQPGAAVAARGRAVDLGEGLEQLRLFVGRDAYAAVPHRKFQQGQVVIALDLPGLDLDLPLLGEFQRIGQQVGDHLLQPVRVAAVVLLGLSTPEAMQGQALFHGGVGVQAGHAVQQLLRQEVGGFEFDPSGFHLGQVQDIVQQRQQGLSRAEDGVDEFFALALAELGLQQQLGHAQDAVHRRAQLMAHGCQKAALGDVGGLGIVLGAQQFGFDQLALGNVLQHPDAALVRMRPVYALAGHVYPQRVPVAVHHGQLHRWPQPLVQQGVLLDAEGLVVFVAGVVHARAAPYRLRHLVAEHLGHALVDPDLFAVAHQHDTDGGVVEYGVELVHAQAQRGFQLLALADVARRRIQVRLAVEADAAHGDLHIDHRAVLAPVLRFYRARSGHQRVQALVQLRGAGENVPIRHLLAAQLLGRVAQHAGKRGTELHQGPSFVEDVDAVAGGVEQGLQAFRHALLLGDILNLGHGVLHAAFSVAHRRHAELNPDHMALLVQVALLHLERVGMPLQQCLDLSLVGREIVRVGQGLEIQGQQFGLAVAGHRAQRVVDLEEAALR